MAVYLGALPAGWTPPEWWADVQVSEGGRVILPPGRTMSLEEMSLFTQWKATGADPVQELARLQRLRAARAKGGGFPWKWVLPLVGAFLFLRKR